MESIPLKTYYVHFVNKHNIFKIKYLYNIYCLVSVAFVQHVQSD